MWGRIRRRDHEAVLVLEIQEGEGVALPVSVRTGAMQAQDEGDFLARFQIAWIVEKIGAPRLHLDDRSLIDNAVACTVRLRAVHRWRRDTRCAGELERLLTAGDACTCQGGAREDEDSE